MARLLGSALALLALSQTGQAELLVDGTGINFDYLGLSDWEYSGKLLWGLMGQNIGDALGWKSMAANNLVNEVVSKDFDVESTSYARSQEGGSGWIINKERCPNDEMPYGFWDTHPFHKSIYAGLLKDWYNDGILRGNGKPGGANATEDTPMHPWVVKFEGYGFGEPMMPGRMCILLREYARIFNFDTPGHNGDLEAAKVIRDFWDWMEAEKAKDYWEWHRLDTNCIKAEGSGPSTQRNMPAALKNIKLVDSAIERKIHLHFFYSNARFALNRWITAWNGYLWVYRFASICNIGTIGKIIIHDFAQQCLTHPDIAYPKATEGIALMDKWFEQYKELDHYLFSDLFREFSGSRTISWGSLNDRLVSATYKKENEHTLLYVNATYNNKNGYDAEGKMTRFEPGDDGGWTAGGVVNGAHDYVNFTGAAYSYRVPVTEFPFYKTISSDKRGSYLNGHIWLLIINMVTYHFHGEYFSGRVSGLPEAEQMALLRAQSWAVVKGGCEHNPMEAETWLDYKKWAMRQLRLHSTALQPPVEGYPEGNQDCRYLDWMNTMQDPQTYQNMGFDFSGAVAMSVVHTNADRIVHVMSWSLSRMIQIASGEDLIIMFESILKTTAFLIALRIALFYVKIQPARIGRQFDNRDQYARAFRQIRTHRAEFLRKSKKLSSQYLQKTPGLKARRDAWKGSDAKAHESQLRDKIFLKKYEAHCIHEVDYFNLSYMDKCEHSKIQKSHKPTKPDFERLHYNKEQDFIFSIFILLAVILLGATSANFVGLITFSM